MPRRFSQDNSAASVQVGQQPGLANQLVRGLPLAGNPLKVSFSSACCNVFTITSRTGSPVEGPFYPMRPWNRLQRKYSRKHEMIIPRNCSNSSGLWVIILYACKLKLGPVSQVTLALVCGFCPQNNWDHATELCTSISTQNSSYSKTAIFTRQRSMNYRQDWRRRMKKSHQQRYSHTSDRAVCCWYTLSNFQLSQIKGREG